MPKKSERASPKEQIALVVPREQLNSELQARIAAGTGLRDRVVTDAAGVKQLRADHYTWDEYNFALLKMRFSDDSIASEYRGFTLGIADDDNPGRELTRRKEDIASDIRRLESIKSRLTIYAEAASVVHRPTERPAGAGERVFVVHGHDAGKRVEVARLLERLGLNATILSEQANAGRTLIEKFESHADEVAFAVVVLTGDDEGGPPGGPYRRRGRQNVVLELGFFYGRVGRGRVCLLYDADVELPSDIARYRRRCLRPVRRRRRMEDAVGSELREAGLPVDMNRL